jgi:hypothetical protein
MNFEIKVDLSRFRSWAQRFPVRFKAECAAAAQKSGDYLLKVLQECFTFQRPEWAPLSASYKKWKEEKGFDSRIMIRSGLMMQSMRFRRIGLGGWVGIPDGIYWPPGLEGKASWSKKGRTPKAFRGSSQPSIAQIVGWQAAHGRRLFEPVALENAKFIVQFYVQALMNAVNGT